MDGLMDIIGLGIDATEIARVAATIDRYGERFLTKVFTEGEIAYCRARRNAASSFAARFAAKEAAMKALGTGYSRGVFWTGIEVFRRTFRRDGRHRVAALAHALARARHRPRDVGSRLATPVYDSAHRLSTPHFLVNRNLFSHSHFPRRDCASRHGRPFAFPRMPAFARGWTRDVVRQARMPWS
jgi:holo-[acyl-carrier protein] synthase